jgi:hypothetical protein
VCVSHIMFLFIRDFTDDIPLGELRNVMSAYLKWTKHVDWTDAVLNSDTANMFDGVDPDAKFRFRISSDEAFATTVIITQTLNRDDHDVPEFAEEELRWLHEYLCDMFVKDWKSERVNPYCPVHGSEALSKTLPSEN